MSVPLNSCTAPGAQSVVAGCHQRSREDVGAPAVGAGTGQGQRSRADLAQAAGALNCAGERRGITAVEGETAIVDHISDNASADSPIANLQ